MQRGSGSVGLDDSGIVRDDLLDVVGGITKQAMESNGDLAFVLAKGFISRLGSNLVNGTWPLHHVVLPVGRGEVSVARPF